MHQIELFMKYPHDVQEEWFRKLMLSARGTEWGKKYGYSEIEHYSTFAERVPINEYDDLKPYIDRLRNGEQNLLWNSDIKWFAKSSGTTSDKSKFIPVSEEALDECHIKGGKDLLSIYCNNNPDTHIFSGKLLGMGGSHFSDNRDTGTFVGDVSAILMENLPAWVELIRTPELSIALMSEWEEKIEKIARITSKEDVTNITGVPSWTMLLLKRILEITGKSNIREVWPNLELFVHGGVSFTPYRNQFHKLIDGPMNYLETYNASEGFFGIQDRNGADDMLLMLDYGIFYEFIPLELYGKPDAPRLTLKEVELNKDYALILTTNSGLWAYSIGDVVRFISKNPHRILVSGRTKHFTSAFGEHVIAFEVEEAMKATVEKFPAQITEFHLAPQVNPENGELPYHEWFIEFEKEPENLESFRQNLDAEMRKRNTYYDDLIAGNILQVLKITKLQKNAFQEYAKSEGKLGGQNKIPRLANDRKIGDFLKNFKI